MTVCCLPEWSRCCCTCKWHIRDYHHCTTFAHEHGRKPSGCVCSQPKGWICAPPEIGRAYSDWSMHGMCECHTEKRDA